MAAINFSYIRCLKRLMAFWAVPLVMFLKSFSIFTLPSQRCAVVPLASAFRIPTYRLRRLLRLKSLVADNALFNHARPLSGKWGVSAPAR